TRAPRLRGSPLRVRPLRHSLDASVGCRLRLRGFDVHLTVRSGARQFRVDRIRLALALLEVLHRPLLLRRELCRAATEGERQRANAHAETGEPRYVRLPARGWPYHAVQVHSRSGPQYDTRDRDAR